MKLLLVYPRPNEFSPQKSPPLSILHVGESVRLAKEKGLTDEYHEIRYFDERYDTEATGWANLGWANKVLVSSMTGYQLQGAIKWMKRAKTIGKETIFGGIHPTMQSEQCLEEACVDKVVVGEGELAILEALDGSAKTVYSHPLHKGDDVSPVTQQTLVHFERSSQSGDTILLTSRGCPYKCGFCFNQKFYHQHWHPVDMDRWKWDILYLQSKVGLNKLEHGDDWPGKWERLREILEFLKERKIQYRPSIRANQINAEVARELAQLGVKHVSVGMESGSPRGLSLIQKGITVEDQIRAAACLSREGIWPLYYWIIRFPSEDWDETFQTLEAADEMAKIHRGKLSQTMFTYSATPGSDLWDMVDQTTLPHDLEGWSHYSFNSTGDRLANNLYHIGGLHFHRGEGDKTDRNFPGLSRALIWPFEELASWRWKHRYFEHYDLERKCIENLLKQASRRLHKGGLA